MMCGPKQYRTVIYAVLLIQAFNLSNVRNVPDSFPNTNENITKTATRILAQYFWIKTKDKKNAVFDLFCT